jgi:hypothetical protein
MAVRCPNCNCPHCPAKGPSIEKRIVYRGKRRIFQRRRRECVHCGHSFYTREFHEDKEPGPTSPMNPFFNRPDNDFEDKKPPQDPPNPFLKGTDDGR